MNCSALNTILFLARVYRWRLKVTVALLTGSVQSFC